MRRRIRLAIAHLTGAKMNLNWFAVELKGDRPPKFIAVNPWLGGELAGLIGLG